MRVGAEAPRVTYLFSPIYNERVPLPVRREVGQLVIGSLSAASVSPGFRSLVRDFGMGGVTLFRRNIEGPEQVSDLSRELRGLVRDAPLWVAIDQEGGRVARLNPRRGFPEFPSAAAYADMADAKRADAKASDGAA